LNISCKPLEYHKNWQRLQLNSGSIDTSKIVSHENILETRREKQTAEQTIKKTRFRLIREDILVEHRCFTGLQVRNRIDD
jgi:hypothetical protein